MAEKAAPGARRRPPIYMCGTPREDCIGALMATNHGLSNGKVMAHSRHEQSFACAKRHLLRLGYTQIDSRAFRSPNPDEPTRVLTKKSRFGAKLRNGKEGTRNQPGGKRGGVVVSC